MQLRGSVHVQRLVRPDLVELLTEDVELALLRSAVARRRLERFVLERLVHPLVAPFCCGLPGSVSTGSTPSLSHHTDSWLSRPSVGAENGTPLSVLMLRGSPCSLNSLMNAALVGSSSVPASAWHPRM